jgi:glycosyltransferase involved in cell wall biosynthesis
MIHNRLIVCIASSWDYDPTSKHHLMRVLSQGNKVLWVNYHGTRRPGVTRWDVRDSISAMVRVARGLRPVSDSMWQFTPMVIPGATGGWAARLHERLLIEQIERAVRAVDPTRRLPVQIWTFAPDVHFLRGTLNEECFLYYCVDDYTRFAGFDAEAITRLETRLLTTADLVIGTSRPLCDSKRAIRADIEYVPHGVDFDHFAAAWRTPPDTPGDLQPIARPIFGFFGLIHHWFDVELLARVARLRPQYSFVLIGDCKIDAGSLSAPNIHRLGRREYARLPAYAAAFQAGMVPFVRNDMTRCINPIKLMEYLAAGRPVVSTSLPAAAEIPRGVFLADEPEAFAEACDRCLILTEADHVRISDQVRPHTWEARARTVSQLVSACAVPRAAVEPEPVNAPVSRGYWQPLEGFLGYPSR